MKKQALKPIEILLVEDSPGDIRLTQEALKGAKMPNRLHVVRDGVEAMQFLHGKAPFEDAHRPDLVLLDLNMPRMSGREVLAAMKSESRLQMIPVVVLTTSDADRDISESYQHSANCFITKPLDLDHFQRVIDLIHDFWLTVVQLPASMDSGSRQKEDLSPSSVESMSDPAEEPPSGSNREPVR